MFNKKELEKFVNNTVEKRYAVECKSYFSPPGEIFIVIKSDEEFLPTSRRLIPFVEGIIWTLVDTQKWHQVCHVSIYPSPFKIHGTELVVE